MQALTLTGDPETPYVPGYAYALSRCEANVVRPRLSDLIAEEKIEGDPPWSQSGNRTPYPSRVMIHPKKLGLYFLIGDPRRGEVRNRTPCLALAVNHSSRVGLWFAFRATRSASATPRR